MSLANDYLARVAHRRLMNPYGTLVERIPQFDDEQQLCEFRDEVTEWATRRGEMVRHTGEHAVFSRTLDLIARRGLR